MTSKIQSFHPFTFSDISWKFHQNPSISFWFILYINTSGSLDPDDPDHSQNLITCSLSHLGHFLKISSNRWPRSLQKCNHLFLVPFRSFVENVHPWLFELFVFKNYISWIQKIQIVVQITRKIESFFSFYHFFLLPFLTYPKNIITIHPKILLQPGSRWSRSLQKCNHLFLVPFRSFVENVHP